MSTPTTGWYRAARAAYDVDAATMHMERTWNDMNAASTPYDLVLTGQTG